jgi:threonine/homoserine/homoserine lactone efflux protein
MPPTAAAGALIFIMCGLVALYLCWIAWMTIRDAFWGSENRSLSHDSWRIKAYVVGFWIFLPCAFFFMSVIGGMNVPPTAYVVDLPILVVGVGVAPICVLSLEWLCGKFPALKRKLLLRPATQTSEWMWFKFELKLDDLSNLMFFLLNLAFSVAWYSLKYNPEGTVNPGWTGIFG